MAAGLLRIASSLQNRAPPVVHFAAFLIWSPAGAWQTLTFCGGGKLTALIVALISARRAIVTGFSPGRVIPPRPRANPNLKHTRAAVHVPSSRPGPALAGAFRRAATLTGAIANGRRRHRYAARERLGQRRIRMDKYAPEEPWR